MKKILTILGSFTLFASPISATVSCFSIGEDALIYLSSKITGDYQNSNKKKIIKFTKSDHEIAYDYSPLLTDFLKLMGSDKFDTNKYRSLQMQFLTEQEFFDYQTENSGEKPNIEYQVQDPKKQSPYQANYKNQDDEEIFDLLQIIRVENYQDSPVQVGNDIYFKEVLVREWNFNDDGSGIGFYEATKNTKKVEIYVRNKTIVELSEEAITIN
ncbi:hypothetical protein SSABA_v1c08500 [Spiroplasma sabaudiense Ar-1343]|uniref:Lipoprotein n=1 Tax=Spiroplasma sabaudiense Ar-1343 TaxID=1276257 RepID=W6AKK8_9MOLU|nr:lipoprotein [Spiroplasma sabaudiense]AHI54249.1 hypothetical protein SSABA_v1c08500 [Spiroplasma sabaudiense Ar-1343]